jgi:glutamyl-tRNA synthetase
MAPSPTGFVHLGSARTALFDHLYARRHGGRFVLRIEDTDVERNRAEYETTIYEGLHWLGLRWDEGPDVGGDFGPYRQSERMDTYREAAARLLKAGSAYRCFCTREELAAEREAAEREKRPYVYSRRCLKDPPKDRTEFVVRLQVPEGKISWDDRVRGTVEFDLAVISDPILMRANGTPLYNFSVAVDDALMQMTHVFRGEEHISNTPIQLLVLDAVGSPRPIYAHLPVIIGKDRAKLSKRKHPEARLSLYQEQGYLPEAMVNYLALLGWNPGTEREIFTLAELELVFDLDRVQKASAMLDLEKLDWLNGQYIRALPDGELAVRLAPFLPELPPDKVAEAVPALKERLPRLAEARPLLDYLWTQPGPPQLDDESRQKLSILRPALDSVAWEPEAIEAALNGVLEQHGWSKNSLFKPLRLALTGKTVSPPAHWTLALLPRDEALRRIDRVLQ